MSVEVAHAYGRVARERDEVVKPLIPIWMFALVAGCGDSAASTTDGSVDSPDSSAACSSLGSASWVGTENVVVTAGTCSSYSDLSVTFTITQQPGTCLFTLTNSRASGVTFNGLIRGDQVSWTTAPYPYLGATLTLLSVSATVSSDVRSLTGSFTWSLTGTTLNCTGTTSFNLTRQSST